MAWLHAAPKRHNKEENPVSRFKRLDKDDPAMSLPDIDQYFVLCFELSGMFLSDGMSKTAITWQELDSFIERSKYPLTGFEAEQIIKMSRDYCNFSNKANNKNCQSPLLGEIFEDEELKQQMRDKVSRQWDSMEKAKNN